MLDIREAIDHWLTQRSIDERDAFEPWLATMTERRFARDEMLISAGQSSRQVFILLQGLVRLFYTTPEGKERNKAFFGPGDFTGAVSAAMTGGPAPFGIQALEPVVAISTDYEMLLQLAHSHSEINRLCMELLSEAFIRNEQREAMLLTCNAEQRYQWLQSQQPELLKQVPQFHIATYIGVDPVSLSRLKRKLSDGEHSDGED